MLYIFINSFKAVHGIQYITGGWGGLSHHIARNLSEKYIYVESHKTSPRLCMNWSILASVFPPTIWRSLVLILYKRAECCAGSPLV